MSKKIKILLVEDNPVDALLISHTLQDESSSVNIQHASCRESFVKALAASGYDVILCDHFLNDFNSLQALDIMKESKLETPFIIVTRHTDDTLAKQAISNGAYDYVSKNNLFHLSTAVRNAINYFELQHEVKALREKAGK